MKQAYNLRGTKQKSIIMLFWSLWKVWSLRLNRKGRNTGLIKGEFGKIVANTSYFQSYYRWINNPTLNESLEKNYILGL